MGGWLKRSNVYLAPRHFPWIICLPPRTPVVRSALLTVFLLEGVGSVFGKGREAAVNLESKNVEGVFNFWLFGEDTGYPWLFARGLVYLLGLECIEMNGNDMNKACLHF
jgi:hypothetical protein